jgi:hypothetical protein
MYYDDRNCELSNQYENIQKKETKLKNPIYFTLSTTSTTRLGIDFTFATKFGANFKSTTRLMVIEQF